MFDSNLMFRTTGSLTASESGGPLTIHGTPIKGMAAKVVIPSSASIGAADTIQAKLYASTDGSTYNVIAQTAVTTPGAATAQQFVIPFSLPKGQKTYLKLELIVTATTSAWGTVVAGLVLGRGAEVDRTVGWTL